MFYIGKDSMKESHDKASRGAFLISTTNYRADSRKQTHIDKAFLKSATSYRADLRGKIHKDKASYGSFRKSAIYCRVDFRGKT